MGTQFLIDTNIGIYLLNGSLNPIALQFIEPIINGIYNMSVITKIELLGFAFTDQNQHLDTRNFIDEGVVISLTDEVIDKTIVLRQSHKIKLPDAIIAATAMVFDFTLISRNDKDFESIVGLKYINPFN